MYCGPNTLKTAKVVLITIDAKNQSENHKFETFSIVLCSKIEKKVKKKKEFQKLVITYGPRELFEFADRIGSLTFSLDVTSGSVSMLEV